MARKLRIITVGRNHDKLLLPLIEDYESRISRTLRIEWLIVPLKSGSPERGVLIAAESNSILASLKNTEYVILLDDIGIQLTSENFSGKLEKLLQSEKGISFVIGGAFGVNHAVRERADFVLSLSKMVIPHQLVRLILVEQLYRALSISNGSNYHHGVKDS